MEQAIAGSRRLDMFRAAAESGATVTRFDLGRRPVFFVNEGSLINELLNEHGDALEKSEFQNEVMAGAQGLGHGFGNGLLTSSSAAHKRQHKLIVRVFDGEHLNAYVPTMAQCAREVMQGWRGGETRDLVPGLMDISLQCVSRTLLSTDFGEERDRLTRQILDVTGYIGKERESRRSAQEDADEVKRAVAASHETIDRMVLARVGADRAGLPDLIDILFEARIEDARRLRQGERLDYLASDRQIHDDLVTMLFTGSENPKNALLWTLWMLGRHPEVLARVQAEVLEVVGQRAIEREDLDKLTYTTQVYKEVLRLYPPGYAFGRRTTRSIALGATQIPADAEVLVSPYALHRRADCFPDPERFDPERFSAPRERQLPRHAYLPFGLGTRACIGGTFAMLEGPVVLATLLQRFRVRLESPDAPLEAVATITLRPRGELRMHLESLDGPAPGTARA